MKNHIIAAIAAIGMALGVVTGTASAAYAYGVTYTPQPTIKWGTSQVMGGVSWSGTAGTNFQVQAQTMRYTGTGWVGQGSIVTYLMNKGVRYGGTSNWFAPCQPGAFTYRTRVRAVSNGSYFPWAYSAGRNHAC